jgi:hypothetical protein
MCEFLGDPGMRRDDKKKIGFLNLIALLAGGRGWIERVFLFR